MSTVSNTTYTWSHLPKALSFQEDFFSFNYRLFPFLVRWYLTVSFNKAFAKSTLVPDYISSTCQEDTAHTNYSLSESEILKFNNSESETQEWASLLLLNIVQFTKYKKKEMKPRYKRPLFHLKTALFCCPTAWSKWTHVHQKMRKINQGMKGRRGKH